MLFDVAKYGVVCPHHPPLPKSKKGDPLTRMLGVLLAPGIRAKEKIQQLETEFAIPMETETIGEELNQMCNLSDYVEELGIQKGLERGLEQGFEQGKEQLLRLQIEKKLAKGLSLSEIIQQNNRMKKIFK